MGTWRIRSPILFFIGLVLFVEQNIKRTMMLRGAVVKTEKPNFPLLNELQNSQKKALLLGVIFLFNEGLIDREERDILQSRVTREKYNKRK